jgi:hypothetical protein
MLLKEAARVLRSGGLIIAADASRALVNNENTVQDRSTFLMSEKYRGEMFELIRDRGMNWSGSDISTMINETSMFGTPETIVIAVGVGSTL